MRTTPRHFVVYTPHENFMVKAQDVGEAAAVARSECSVQTSTYHILPVDDEPQVFPKFMG